MKKLAVLLVAIATLGIYSPVRADLGDSLKESIQQYGNPVNHRGNVYLFWGSK